MLMTKAIISVSLILFSVIDIPGSLPILINLKKKGVQISPSTATLVAGILMIGFMFFGVTILSLFHIDISSFAMAGSLIILFIGLEMILGIRIFRDSEDASGSGNVVPVAFPLLAGAGTLTTIISLKAEHTTLAVLGGIIVNLVIIFLVLRSTSYLSRVMSEQLLGTLRKVFGILLIAIAFQMFKANLL